MGWEQKTKLGPIPAIKLALGASDNGKSLLELAARPFRRFTSARTQFGASWKETIGPQLWTTSKMASGAELGALSDAASNMEAGSGRLARSGPKDESMVFKGMIC